MELNEGFRNADSLTSKVLRLNLELFEITASFSSREGEIFDSLIDFASQTMQELTEMVQEADPISGREEDALATAAAVVYCTQSKLLNKFARKLLEERSK
jgi:hypothetical protein